MKTSFQKKLLCGLLIAFVFAVFFVPFASAASYVVTKVNGSDIVPEIKLDNSTTFMLNTLTFEATVPIGATVSLDTKSSEFIFISEKQSYIATASGTADVACNFALEVLSVSTGYYDIPLIIDDGSGTTSSSSFRIHITEKYVAPPPPMPEPTPEPTPEPVSIPKVIVSGFRTEPSQVVAGEEFVLYLTYKNTSTTGNISNFKISLTSDGTFNAVSGSLTSFISNIVAGESQTTSISLMPKADTAPGSYNVNLALNYDASGTMDNTPVTDTEVIAIPVEQIPEAKLQQIEIVPEAPFVGQDLNLMCSVNNTGKSTLYNVTATVSADGEYIEPQELYLGNIESGSTGNVDIYATPLKEGMANVKLTLTYEDEKGKVFDLSDTREVYISTYMPPDIGPEIMPPEQEGGSIVPWVVAIVLLLIGGGATAIILVKRKNKKIKAARDREIARQIEQQMIYQNSGYINNNGIYNNGNNGGY